MDTVRTPGRCCSSLATPAIAPLSADSSTMTSLPCCATSCSSAPGIAVTVERTAVQPASVACTSKLAMWTRGSVSLPEESEPPKESNERREKMRMGCLHRRRTGDDLIHPDQEAVTRDDDHRENGRQDQCQEDEDGQLATLVHVHGVFGPVWLQQPSSLLPEAR